MLENPLKLLGIKILEVEVKPLLIGWLCFVFFVCGAVNAQPDQGNIRPQIGVSEFEVSEKIDVSYGNVLYDLFLAQIVSSGKVTVVDSGEMKRVREHIAATDPNLSRAETERRAARELGLEKLYMGSLARMGGKYYLAVKELNLDLTVERVLKETAQSEDMLEQSIHALTERLLQIYEAPAEQKHEEENQSVATPEEMPSVSSRLPTCLLPVSAASFTSLQGLSGGSLEALEIQRQTVEKTGYPLEVKTKGIGIHLRLVPAGTFMMGSPRSEFGRHQDEGALHRVTISSHFYMSKYEITQGQWEAVMGNNPSRFKDSGKNAPVENVNWDQCRDFCMMLSREEGASTQVFHLPTEAQWEYACRAGTTAPSVGDIQFLGWYEGNSDEKTHPVGLKGANAWGLFDMYGNVYEWCRDWYQDRYSPEDAGDPTGPQNGNYRVLRGGSWFNDADYFRSANRGRYSPGNRREIIGFRVVMPIDDIK